MSNNTVSIINQTTSALSYVNSQVSVSSGSTTTVPYGLLPYLALDPNFISDANGLRIILSDGMNQYTGAAITKYLSTWLASGAPQNSSDPVTFTLAGMGFSTTGNASLNNTTETPVILLANPSNSGINARAMYFYAAPNSTQGIVTVNIYTNPTVSANGTAVTPVNNLVSASAPLSSMNLYGGPTISANGTKRLTVVTNAGADASLFNFAQTAILAPGNTMLMTVTVGNIGLLSSVNTYFYLQWVEA
jgi:hypothetical protein